MYYYTSATDFRHARREKSPHKRNNKRSSTGRDSSALTEEQQKIRAELNHLSAKLVKAELTNDEGAIDILKNSIKETRLKLKEIEESPGPSSVEQQSNVSPASSEGDLKTEINIISAKIIKAELENDTKLIEKLQEKLTMLRTQLLSSQGSAQLNEVQKIEESEPETSNQRNYDSKKDDHNLCSRNESVDKKWKKMKMEFGEVQFKSSSEAEGKESEPSADASDSTESTSTNCFNCLNTNKGVNSRIISIGQYAYLAMPHHEGLLDGHCIISSIQHIECSTHLEKNMWREINLYRELLIEMFETQSKELYFFETVRHIKSSGLHLEIHCIPVPSRHCEVLPFYFKKAISEVETDTMNNSLIKITNCEHLMTYYIPKGLPYFWITFGLSFGYAHVIEDTRKFSDTFAQEVIGGHLDLDYSKWRKPKAERNLPQKISNFKRQWEDYEKRIQESFG